MRASNSPGSSAPRMERTTPHRAGVTHEARDLMATQPISADFPYEPNFVEVHGSRIHFVKEETQ